MIAHIADRTLVHLFSDPGIVLAVTFALRLLQRKTRKRWLPKTAYQTICTAGFLALPVAIMREPADMRAGGWWVKSYIDIVEHLIFIPLACWALYRLIAWGIECERQEKAKC